MDAEILLQTAGYKETKTDKEHRQSHTVGAEILLHLQRARYKETKTDKET